MFKFQYWYWAYHRHPQWPILCRFQSVLAPRELKEGRLLFVTDSLLYRSRKLDCLTIPLASGLVFAYSPPTCMASILVSENRWLLESYFKKSHVVLTVVWLNFKVREGTVKDVQIICGCDRLRNFHQKSKLRYFESERDHDIKVGTIIQIVSHKIDLNARAKQIGD